MVVRVVGLSEGTGDEGEAAGCRGGWHAKRAGDFPIIEDYKLIKTVDLISVSGNFFGAE